MSSVSVCLIVAPPAFVNATIGISKLTHSVSNIGADDPLTLIHAVHRELQIPLLNFLTHFRWLLFRIIEISQLCPQYHDLAVCVRGHLPERHLKTKMLVIALL